MQDSVSSMLTDLTVNAVNIVASIVLTLGIGGWEGLGFDGIALGTVVAQYSGLLLAVLMVTFKYRLPAGRPSGQGGVLHRLLTLNSDLFIRSLCFTGIYLGFTMIAAQYGDALLACANIMMNLLMIFSYFTDGFAYAGEALTGRFIGERDREMTSRSVRHVFVWSMAVAGIWMVIYWAAGMPLLRFMTDDASVVEACREFLPWLVVMPPLGCAAFTWDGIYIGATASRGIRDAMIAAFVAFLGTWFIGEAIISPGGAAAIHLLFATYFAHLATRTVWLSVAWRKVEESTFS